MSEKTSTTNRTWLIGGIFLFVILLCVACFVFMVFQYRSAITAYAWVQIANDGQANEANDMICEGSQAEIFGDAFHARYGDSIKITVSNFEESDRKVTFEGALEIDGDESDYQATFHISDDNGRGFLGLFGCVERIELVDPDTMPIDYFGG